ncbi:unnamed protein product [Gongylonema pulchrum]|uniref:Transducin/WD40 repeat-like superfamily protein n=1 Tax=Gongylonema pulchrum TaxID=637853 RepID=A0A183ES65_9BILA|nr:unnamed protein product [Gongylonema pulchrum]
MIMWNVIAYHLFRNDGKLLCLGCSRSLKFFDLRESVRPVCSLPMPNLVRSVSAADRHPCIACIVEDFISIYDRRRLTSPLYRILIPYFVSTAFLSPGFMWLSSWNSWI